MTATEQTIAEKVDQYLRFLRDWWARYPWKNPAFRPKEIPVSQEFYDELGRRVPEPDKAQFMGIPFVVGGE